MIRPLTFLSRASTGLKLGLVCALATCVVTPSGWLDRLEDAAMDALFQARDARFPDPRITLLVADDATVAQVGRWPLPRHVYADVVRRLDRAGAKTIVFDVLFSVPSSSLTKDDADFAAACRQSKRVVQAAVFFVPQVYNQDLPANLVSDKRAPAKRFAIDNRGAHSLSATWVNSALPALQSSAPALGHVNVFPEVDGTLRRIPLIRYRDQIYPSLAVTGAAHFLGVSPTQIHALPDSLEIVPKDQTPRVMPLDKHGETFVNWIGGNGSFPTYNFTQLRNGKVPAIALKDRIVLVGVTAAGAFESRSTPFSPMQPAVELQANAIDDILSNRPLREISLWHLYLLLVVVGLVAGIAISPRRAAAGAIWALGLDILLWRSAVWSMGNLDLYIPIGTPMLSVLSIYAVATAWNYRREWEANWRVDTAVDALARGGALMASGRDRATLLQVIKETAREVLQAREIVLVLQPQHEILEEETSVSLFTAARQVFAAGRRIPLLRTRQLSPHRESTSTHSPGGDFNEPRDPLALGGTERVTLTQPSPAVHELMHILAREPQNTLQPAESSSTHGSLSHSSLHPVLGAPVFKGIQDFRTGDESIMKDAGGLLLAIGRSDGKSFTSRDATLLATLADQAALALDNLAYFEMLRGKIDLANADLRRAYETLEEERAKLAAAMESNESAVIIGNEENRAIFINAASGQILAGINVGDSVPDALSRIGLSKFSALFSSYGKGGTTTPNSTGNDVPMVRGTSPVAAEISRTADRSSNHDPVRSVLHAQLNHLNGTDGRWMGTMLVVSDVTSQRELDAMKDDFIAYVAHELRSPLSTINGYASLLKLDEVDFPDEEKKEMLLSIEDQCRRLNRMVNDLLDVAGIEEIQDVQHSISTFDLVSLCERVIEDQNAAISPGHPIEFHLSFDQRPLEITMDADRIEQVLINLISNAVKYSPQGSKVSVSLRELSIEGRPEVEICVTDTGMGMTSHQTSQLFRKYYRAPEAKILGVKGTGLGLHLVKKIVEAQNGRISVESEYGQGSTFIVTLPNDLLD